jgi:hypothetical protein
MKIVLFFLLCAAAGFSAIKAGETAGAETDPNNDAIRQFNTKFSLGLNTKFNFALYAGGEITGNSNAPVFLGFSFGYKDYSLFFTIAQNYTYTPAPGKHTAFDAALAFYQEHWFEELSIRFYDDFKTGDAPFDFQYISGNLSGVYVFNADSFSLRSVYPMNRLQRSSAGSFMAGGSIRASGIQSKDIPHFNDRLWYIAAGPGAGYSYTFILQDQFFINFFLLAGINMGIALPRRAFIFSPFVTPKIAVGRHYKTWSLNFVLQADCLSFIGADRTHNSFVFNSAALGASKRF